MRFPLQFQQSSAWMSEIFSVSSLLTPCPSVTAPATSITAAMSTAERIVRAPLPTEVPGGGEEEKKRETAAEKGQGSSRAENGEGATGRVSQSALGRDRGDLHAFALTLPASERSWRVRGACEAWRGRQVTVRGELQLPP